MHLTTTRTYIPGKPTARRTKGTEGTPQVRSIRIDIACQSSWWSECRCPTRVLSSGCLPCWISSCSLCSLRSAKNNNNNNNKDNYYNVKKAVLMIKNCQYSWRNLLCAVFPFIGNNIIHTRVAVCGGGGRLICNFSIIYCVCRQ